MRIQKLSQPRHVIHKISLACNAIGAVFFLSFLLAVPAIPHSTHIYLSGVKPNTSELVGRNHKHPPQLTQRSRDRPLADGRSLAHYIYDTQLFQYKSLNIHKIAFQYESIISIEVLIFIEPSFFHGTTVWKTSLIAMTRMRAIANRKPPDFAGLLSSALHRILCARYLAEILKSLPPTKPFLKTSSQVWWSLHLPDTRLDLEKGCGGVLAALL